MERGQDGAGIEKDGTQKQPSQEKFGSIKTSKGVGEYANVGSFFVRNRGRPGCYHGLPG
jgi:hypothetical protein